MNIFYLHKNPVIAAKVQYNKHVVKMILESAQMLCTAHHHYAEQYEYDNSTNMTIVIYLIKKLITITHLQYGHAKAMSITSGCLTT
jgi:hypothetical protein